MNLFEAMDEVQKQQTKSILMNLFRYYKPQNATLGIQKYASGAYEPANKYANRLASYFLTPLIDDLLAQDEPRIQNQQVIQAIKMLGEFPEQEQVAILTQNINRISQEIISLVEKEYKPYGNDVIRGSVDIAKKTLAKRFQDEINNTINMRNARESDPGAFRRQES